MPFIVAPIAAALVSIGLSAALASAIATVLVNVVLATVVGFISKALMKPPKRPDNSLGSTSRENKQMVRQPVAPFSITYGEDRISGPITFIEPSNQNQNLHMLLTLSACPFAYWKRVYLNDEYIPIKADGTLPSPPDVHGPLAIEGGVNGSFGETMPNLNTTIGDSLKQFQAQNTDDADDTVKFPSNETGIKPLAQTKWWNAINVFIGLGSANSDSALHAKIREAVGAEMWSTSHLQSGCAKLYAKFIWSASILGGGLPTITAVVGGKPIYDPRDTGESIGASVVGSSGQLTITGHSFAVDDFIWVTGHTGATPDIKKMYRVSAVPDANHVTIVDRWDQPVNVTVAGSGGTATKMWPSNIVPLIARDYLTDPVYGRNAEDDMIDDTDTIASANTAEEQVVLKQSETGTFDTFTISNDFVVLSTHIAFLRHGDGVRFTSTGTLPTGIVADTTYYWMEDRFGVGKLAPTYKDAMRRTNVISLSGGTGTHTMLRYSEARYICDFTFKTDESPKTILALFANSMAGNIICEGGLWRILAGGWRTPTFLIEDKDFDGPIELSGAVARQEIFNGVKGTFVNREKFWQADSFPAVINATYLAQDGGYKLWNDIDLPASGSPSRCQRIGKIRLEQMRQQITATLPLKLRAFVLMPTSTILWTRPRYGFDEKYFETLNWKFTLRGDGEKRRIGIDVSVRETAPTVWDWNNGEETTVDLAPNTSLPKFNDVAEPTDLEAEEEQYVTRDASGVKTKVILTWKVSPDGFVDSYEIRYSFVGSTEYTYIAEAPGDATRAEIPDIAISGTYLFEIRARNHFGGYSTWVPHTQFISGLSADPVALTGFTGAIAGSFLYARWDQSTDIDVRIGGEIEFRWTPTPDETDASKSVKIRDNVEGKMTAATMPFKPGTYFIIPIDSEGHRGEATPFTTIGAEVLPWSALTTIQEDSTFLGTKTNMILDGTNLKLAGAGLVDDMPNVDAVADWDSYGGIAAAGTYRFATNYDRGSVGRFRVRTHLRVATDNPFDLMDDWVGNIDDRETWDGASPSGVIDAQIWLRSTDDDPAGTPTWSSWHRGDLNEYNARAVQAEIRAVSYDTSYNILIDQARIDMEELP